ncbi:MAG TPA: DinB family protein [Pilimelia sp.]|nr:DinB family protein [Pilimelia sp.]
MKATDVLAELYSRLPALVHAAVVDLTPAQLCAVPAAAANPVGWLVWHLARVQDAHVAEILDVDQVWTAGAHAGRFGLAADPADTGYGHTPAQVAAVRPENWRVLEEYHAAVQERTHRLLAALPDAGLDRVVDAGWDPPVTLGVRLCSVADDSLQHLGQAAYVRTLMTAPASVH